MLKFEWDSQKEASNIKKHGVSFEEAKEALTCGLIVVLKEDDNHNEDRYVFLGVCKNLRVLVVVVTFPTEVVTRIISARKATRRERLFYEEEL